MKKSDKKRKHQSSKNEHSSTQKDTSLKAQKKLKANIGKTNTGIKTKKWFYAVLLILPFLFFILLEISLQMFDYGYNTKQWLDAGGGKFIINPDISKRYFNNVSFAPITSEDVFDQQKKTNSFRVFVIGGSSAAGFPYMPMGSFSRYVKKRLELVYPNTPIEVVNISMTAINSYTLLDLFPGILDQKPNLVLIYAGHNEYYGALGVGSVESFGNSRLLIKSILYLNQFKTTQLIRNFITKIFSAFASSNENASNGTLMSKIAKDKSIKLNSEKFYSGVEQFYNNIKEISEEARDKNVPIIIGNLVSNLKDQKPFISIQTDGFGNANEIYSEAKKELKTGNNIKADSLFRLAKDLDGLRFRAPEKINIIIDSISNEFNLPKVPLDSIFNSNSQDGIVGNNFMVDHLHPTINGYRLIGKSFYEEMVKQKFLPQNETQQIPFNKQDSATIKNIMFTELDQTIGDYLVTSLKNDWPFKNENEKIPLISLLVPRNFMDSVALKVIEEKITWAEAQVEAATYYLRKDDIKNYLNHMNVLIYQYP
ncbi:MAG: SGNH/GDSL hydrolase family protein, partial [Ignavibacteriae bacterium]|nr:SGNH/GDSL hydrolase family protein [Ignavibacteriota bacterium]